MTMTTRRRLTLRTARPFHDPALLPGVEFLIAKIKSRRGEDEEELVLEAQASVVMARNGGGHRRGGDEKEAQHPQLLLELELGLELRLRPLLRRGTKKDAGKEDGLSVRVVRVEMRPSGRRAVVSLLRRT